MILIAVILGTIIIIAIAFYIAATFCFDDDDKDMDWYNSQR